MQNYLLQTKTVGDFARLVREREEKNQGQWAKLIGYSQSMISQVETNRHQQPIMYLKSLLPYLSRNEIRHLQFLLYREVDFNLGLG